LGKGVWKKAEIAEEADYLQDQGPKTEHRYGAGQGEGSIDEGPGGLRSARSLLRTKVAIEWESYREENVRSEVLMEKGHKLSNVSIKKTLGGKGKNLGLVRGRGAIPRKSVKK